MVLTILAFTGINTATTELALAGNEQSRRNAADAAAAGIEQSISQIALVGTTPGSRAEVEPTVLGAEPNEYSAETRYIGDETGLPQSSADKFVGLHFEIESTGTSARNGRDVQDAGRDGDRQHRRRRQYRARPTRRRSRRRGPRMKHTTQAWMIPLLFCAALSAANASAAPQTLRAVELAVETSTRNITLPAGDAGSISVTPCSGCKPLVLFTGARTRYFLDGQELPAAGLRRALAGRTPMRASCCCTAGARARSHVSIAAIPDAAPRAASRGRADDAEGCRTSSLPRRLAALLTGVLATLASLSPALADDSEIFVNQGCGQRRATQRAQAAFTACRVLKLSLQSSTTSWLATAASSQAASARCVMA